MKQRRPGATARDVMRTEIATLSTDDTIQTALELFEESGISGAPVVANERLVGMLTLADLARTEHRKDGRIQANGDYELGEPTGEELADELDPAEVFFSKEDYSPEVLGRTLVGDWMSRGVVSVPPEATLAEVCGVMVNEQIHRVCVLEQGRLVGLVTTFDIVRHVARAPAVAPHAPRRARAASRRSAKGIRR